jgi:Holliday junction resolvase-like predicted endonuclease
MANPSKAKGTRAETKIARFLAERGLRTVRRALAGSADEGDLRMFLPDGEEVTVEVKAGKQTAAPSRSLLDSWMRQTMEESENSGCRSLLIVVRYRRPFADAEVWLPNSQWGGGIRGWTMVRIDDFADEMWAIA